ncbi:MAG: hypothetical protein ACXW5U_18800 [Thermoanaerobaculia bacterium]
MKDEDKNEPCRPSSLPLDAVHASDVLITAMRPLALLLFTTTLSAQWVSPIEQSYGPYLAPASGGAPALVASNDSVLLAWSELDPMTRRAEIRTGILDFSGRLVSEITTLPTWQAGADAIGPVVATDGGAFAVAWMESQRHTRLAAVPLSADGIPVAEPRTFGGYFHGAATPVLVWSGEAFVFSGNAFDLLGEPVAPPPVSPTGLRYGSGNALVGLAWSTLPLRYSCGIGIGHGCVWLDPEFVVTWEIVRGTRSESASKKYRYHVETPPLTAGDDDELAIVWRSPTALTGVRAFDGVYASSFTILESLAPPEPDGIAFDGERWLVVFTHDRDVWGAFVERTGKDFVPFPIATSGRAESNARVIALAAGRFLVSYASDLGADDHRFAGRIVLTEPPGKRRALR